MVDSGANNTVVTPVVDQKSDSLAAQWKPIGGTHISSHLKECVKMKGMDFEVKFIGSLWHFGADFISTSMLH